jgi:hypothetical protein
MRSLGQVEDGGDFPGLRSETWGTQDIAAGEPSTLARKLTVVKVAKPKQDMRFDVPVIGMRTMETMMRAGATCLSVETGRTLLFDREALLERAAAAGIAIVGSVRAN